MPVHPVVLRLLALAHAALADKGGHVVMAEAGADLERHWSSRISQRRETSFHAQADTGSTGQRGRPHSQGLMLWAASAR